MPLGTNGLRLAGLRIVLGPVPLFCSSSKSLHLSCRTFGPPCPPPAGSLAGPFVHPFGGEVAIQVRLCTTTGPTNSAGVTSLAIFSP